MNEVGGRQASAGVSGGLDVGGLEVPCRVGRKGEQSRHRWPVDAVLVLRGHTRVAAAGPATGLPASVRRKASSRFQSDCPPPSRRPGVCRNRARRRAHGTASPAPRDPDHGWLEPVARTLSRPRRRPGGPRPGGWTPCRRGRVRSRASRRAGSADRRDPRRKSVTHRSTRSRLSLGIPTGVPESSTPTCPSSWGRRPSPRPERPGSVRAPVSRGWPSARTPCGCPPRRGAGGGCRLGLANTAGGS